MQTYGSLQVEGIQLLCRPWESEAWHGRSWTDLATQDCASYCCPAAAIASELAPVRELRNRSQYYGTDRELVASIHVSKDAGPRSLSVSGHGGGS